MTNLKKAIELKKLDNKAHRFLSKIQKLEGKISDKEMRELRYQYDRAESEWFDAYRDR